MWENSPFFITSRLQIGQAALLGCLGLWGSGKVSSKVGVSSMVLLLRLLVDLVTRASRSADLMHGFGHHDHDS